MGQIRRFIKKTFAPNRQMSEAFVNSALLAVSGGFMDAYTYNGRGGVFANAETGNIVLFGQRLMERDLGGALKFLAPILAFALGIFIAENFRFKFRYSKKLHWRQGILLAEIVLLAVVGLIPSTPSLDMTANIMVAFSAALQVQAFRKVEGYNFASTMCTGNLRSGTAAPTVYLREKKPEQLAQMLHYYGIILLFALGAGLGGLLTEIYGLHMIWYSCLILFLSFLLMTAEEVEDELEQKHE